MSRSVFAKLLERIRPSLPLEQNSFTGTDGNVIHADVRLAITLRLLASASYLDIRMTWDISQTSFYDIFHSFCTATMTRLSFPGFPENADDLMALSQRFKLSRSLHSPLSGCVGALDVIAVKVKKPSHEHDPASFSVGRAIIPFLFRLWQTQTTVSFHFRRCVKDPHMMLSLTTFQHLRCFCETTNFLQDFG